MREIPLTQGKVALVDDEDFDRLSKKKWYALKMGHVFYAVTGGGKAMHREILGITNPQILCDHKDGNGLNNTRSNLRACTRGENSRNRGANKHKRIPYKGVSRGYLKYTAAITHEGKRYQLGVFDTPEEAARAYDEAAKRLHGVFARTNF